VYEDLLRRVHAAAARAAELVDAAEVAAETAHAIRDGGLRARCAWCGRYRVAERWVAADAIPAFPPSVEQTTHTICPSCSAALRREGQSA
jgi:hypothetical protein